MRPTAIVLNMYYTGLGIARSLGQRGIRVIGLSAHEGIYGNFTRYADVRSAPDSRETPEALLEYLITLGKGLGHRGVLFPTRDDDVIFVDRYRDELAPWFSIVAPPEAAVRICLDKWETSLAACRAGVASPVCWIVSDVEELKSAADEARFPCVLKPQISRHWRQGGNWEIVGARKAIGVASRQELLAEYEVVSRAHPRVVMQEMVPGPDEALYIVACYIDRAGKWAAAFNTRKLLQSPAVFGTGCIVQSVERPELFEPTRRILKHVGFTGIAEVEYKWDSRDGRFKMIEINPRPWDQHMLGHACGVDLAYLAYCDHAGEAVPEPALRRTGQKWLAEDAFLTELVRVAWRRDWGRLRTLLRLARGRRIYGIWSWRDPRPMFIYATTRYLPTLFGSAVRALAARLRRSRRTQAAPERSPV